MDLASFDGLTDVPFLSVKVDTSLLSAPVALSNAL